jgi:hypothetical protein
MCTDQKTIYIREIKDRDLRDKEVLSCKTGEKVTRLRTTHKMRWVRIGRFCPVCLNIEYDSDWLEENKKEYEWLRQDNKGRKIRQNPFLTRGNERNEERSS